MRVVLALAAAVAAMPARAATVPFTEPAAGEANRLCARFAQAEPPAADRPTAAQRSALAGCDGEALLYGIGRPRDPVAARLCAFVQRGDPANKGDPSGLFDGNGLLMTIYANGWGVPRNRTVATHLACEGVQSAEAERQFRVPHLAGTLREPQYTAAFSPCDDITSGLQQGVCALHQSRIVKAGQASAIAAYAARLPPEARPAFAALQKAQAAWSLARGGGEVDLSGSGRAAFEIEEESLQDTDFLDMLTRLGTGRPPRLGTPQLQAAQARIDATLPKLLAQPAPDVPGEVTPDGIRKAQAAWTAYRDAWGAFAAVAYPGWGPDGARAWVTAKRADMLAHMLAAPG